jgi:hypothetical protein
MDLVYVHVPQARRIAAARCQKCDHYAALHDIVRQSRGGRTELQRVGCVHCDCPAKREWAYLWAL